MIQVYLFQEYDTRSFVGIIFFNRDFVTLS